MNVKIISTNQIFNITSEEKIEPGKEILVMIDKVTEPAVVLCEKKCIKASDEENTPQIEFIRLLTEKDYAYKKELEKKANGFLEEAKNKAFRHGLDMKILRADLSYDEKKITFYFSANGRIDFRGLVSDMAGDFRKIIRLQQIGPRDEAKLSGGYGKCGRELCCKRFINNLDSVTYDALDAKDSQNANPAIYTGCCGKLMCCLSFEDKGNSDIIKEEKNDKKSLKAKK